jgi:glutathionylspermidine synthase
LADAAGPDGLVALVHATWHSDDRQVMEYLARRLLDNGVRAEVGGPDDVQWVDADARWREGPSGPQRLVLARFFPAEWLPMLGPRASWERWFRNSHSALSNPGTALLVQSKRLPLVWDFLRAPLSTWRKLLPETRSVREIDGAMSEWVLKPVLGRVGENIGIEGVTDAARYQKLLRDAQRNERKWVAQRRFETVAIPTPDGPRYPCIGVFTVDGRTVGAYGRVATTRRRSDGQRGLRGLGTAR